MLETITTAAAAVDLFGALLFALAFARRPTDIEHWVATLMCFGAAVHAIALGVASPAGTTITGAARVAAFTGLAAALPTVAHFGLAYGAVLLSWWALAAVYIVSVACALFDLFFIAHGPLALAGASAGLATSSAAAAIALVLIAVSVRVYLEGRKESIAIAISAATLLAAAVHDLAVASRALAAGPLVEAGLAAIVAGIMSTRSARYATAARELERRTSELQTRSEELNRSYEHLRATREELVKSEQLAAVGELAAVIAHEVRNPLAIIANAVAGLRKRAITHRDRETLLTILDEETNRLNRLVTNLLRYSRPVRVERTDFSLPEVLERTLSLARSDGRNIKTELRVEGHDGRIWGDPNLLRQVFDNLVVNAVQAMASNGTLTLRVRAARSRGERGVAVDIIDTGEGMDTQVRSRARDPFFTTRPSGTGLGLAIVDRIVDAHGGELAIESRPGQGTTVTVFLPEPSTSETSARGGSSSVTSEASDQTGTGH